MCVKIDACDRLYLLNDKWIALSAICVIRKLDLSQ